MAAPTNPAYVKKALANLEPSTHGRKADGSRPTGVCRHDGQRCRVKSARRPVSIESHRTNIRRPCDRHHLWILHPNRETGSLAPPQGRPTGGLACRPSFFARTIDVRAIPGRQQRLSALSRPFWIRRFFQLDKLKCKTRHKRIVCSCVLRPLQRSDTWSFGGDRTAPDLDCVSLQPCPPFCIRPTP
jgi:hypothetical protein